MIAEFNYTVANAVLTGIFIIPVFVLAIMSIFQVKRRKDPVRDGAPWLKISFMWFFLSLLPTVASDALYAAVVSGYDSSVTSLFKVGNYLSLISGFLEQLATVFCLVAMVEFAYGFYMVLKPGVNSGASIAGDPTRNGVATVEEVGDRSKRRVVQVATAVLGVLLLALSVALLGKALAAYVKYYSLIYSDNNDSSNTDYTYTVANYVASIHVARKLGGAFDILVWVLSLPMLGFAGYLVHRAQGLPIKGTVVLYLVATIFWFLRFLWHLIYNAIWLLPEDSIGAPIWFEIADPLLNVWLFFITLLLLYIMAARRAGGLWSTAQPWTHFGNGYPNQEYGVAQPYQYAGYGVGPQSYAPVPQGPVYHQMQHPAQVHEMAHPVQPVYPQEMYATPQLQYQQPYGINPPAQQHPQQLPPQQHVYGVSPQQTPSPAQSRSAPGVDPTPPPASGTSATPPSELKS
ncbi:hypothetical protein Sste5346_009185 [Sporothrix stenoceras]|uniref:Uncharacterized protein n=1 Tax=Sporothrix stenoceras TaxID=5173 RepID=A0ABR3YMD3_9PEZI